MAGRGSMLPARGPKRQGLVPQVSPAALREPRSSGSWLDKFWGRDAVVNETTQNAASSLDLDDHRRSYTLPGTGFVVAGDLNDGGSCKRTR